MKSILFYALTFFSFCSLWAQQKFENGYYIDNTGKRFDGLVRTANFETLNEKDATLEFKSTADALPEQIAASSISETGISSDTKLRKFNVLIDDGNYFRSDNTEKYTRLERRNLFLNVLVEGAASFFMYDNGNGPKYFYQLKDQANSPPQQLIFKTYLERNAIKENTEFRQQLFNDLKCDGDSFGKFADVKYQRDALLLIVNQYNQCHGGGEIAFKNEKKKKAKVFLSVFVGAYNRTYEVTSDPKPDSKSEFAFSPGIELEILSSGEAWGYFSRIGIERLDAQLAKDTDISEFTDDVRTDDYQLKATAIRWNFGARYHFGRGENNFFADASVGLLLPFGDIDYTRYYNHELITDEVNGRVEAGICTAIGAGYTFKRKYTIAARYDLPTSVSGIKDMKTQYSQFGLNVSYTF